MSRRVEKYEILDEIGHGGMATVYRAHDTLLDRDVALKLMHPHLRSASEARARFSREARTVARLRHPNVLQVYDYSGENSDECFIATELLTGPTLKSFVEAHGPMPAEIVACVGIEVAEALSAAHASGVIHRDVKPENVLLHEKRCLKLADFGIAHMLEAHSMTATGQILGSPAHMAPEQIEGKPSDARADLFSLGTVLYFLATGTQAFLGKNPHQTLRRVLEGSFTDPVRLQPAVGRRMGNILCKLLQVSPDARYPDAHTLVQELRDFLAYSGIEDNEKTLRNYLASPQAFAEELRVSTVEHLLQRAVDAQKNGEKAAMWDALDRVLSLDKQNERALAFVASAQGRDRRRKQMFITVVTTVAVVFSGTVVAWLHSRAPSRERVSVNSSRTAKRFSSAKVSVGQSVPSLLPAAGNSSRRDTSSARGVANVRSFAPKARPNSRTMQDATVHSTEVGGSGMRTVLFSPYPQNISISVDGGDLKPFGPSFRQIELAPGPHRFKFVGGHDCCIDEEFEMEIPEGPGTTVVRRSLQFKPAGLVVRSNVPAKVVVGQGLSSGRAREVIWVPGGRSHRFVHNVTVAAPGYVPVVQEITFQSGEVLTVNVSLEQVEP